LLVRGKSLPETAYRRERRPLFPARLRALVIDHLGAAARSTDAPLAANAFRGLAFCAQLKDTVRNGGRDLALLQEHLAKDDLFAWGWNREPDALPFRERRATGRTHQGVDGYGRSVSLRPAWATAIIIYVVGRYCCLLTWKYSLLLQIFSLLICAGNFLKAPCSTAICCTEILSGIPKFPIFPVKFPVCREFA
jgi:hypothetical protein